MTRANTEQFKHTPWFAKAGAACSIVPIARFVGPNIFALKGGGYGCLFALTGIDEEGLTDQELDPGCGRLKARCAGFPKDRASTSTPASYRVLIFLVRSSTTIPVTQVFADDRLGFLEQTAGFRRIDLHWCLTIEPSKVKAFEQKPKENAADTSRMLAEPPEDGHDSRRSSRQIYWDCGCSTRMRISILLVSLQPGGMVRRRRNSATMPAWTDRSSAIPVAWHSDHHARWQTPRADVLAQDHARGFAAMPLLRPADA